MSAYHTDNKGVKNNALPLFASSWLALFSILRENFLATRASTGKARSPGLKKPATQCKPLPAD